MKELLISSIVDLSGSLKQADTLYDILDDLGYSAAPQSRDRFRPVGWDWRRPVDQRRIKADVADAIVDLHRITGERVTVIAHSTGGLVMRSLLEGPPVRDDLLDRLERLIAIGVPWAGTLQPLPPLAGLSGFGPLNRRDTQRVLGRSWAAFDLLPPNPVTTEMRDGEGELNFFRDPQGQASPLVNTGWIPSGSDFDALRRRAASADSRLGTRQRTLQLGGRTLEVVSFVGWGADTLTRFELDANGGLTPTRSEEGDGTVPRRSAAWLRGATRLVVPLGHTSESQIERRHITLWENPAIRDLLGVFLAGRARPPYTYAAVDRDDAVDIFGATVRVRGVALDEAGRALPDAAMDAAGLRLMLGGDGRGTLPIPRDRIVQRVAGDLFRFEVRFRWQGPGGLQIGTPQVLHIRK